MALFDYDAAVKGQNGIVYKNPLTSTLDPTPGAQDPWLDAIVATGTPDHDPVLGFLPSGNGGARYPYTGLADTTLFDEEGFFYCEVQKEHPALGAAASIESGTTTATTAFKLIDAGQNFEVTVRVGMTVKNTTDTTTALVTVVDSNTELTLDTDIMTTGETFTIHYNPPQPPNFSDGADYSGTSSSFSLIVGNNDLRFLAKGGNNDSIDSVIGSFTTNMDYRNFDFTITSNWRASSFGKSDFVPVIVTWSGGTTAGELITIIDDYPEQAKVITASVVDILEGIFLGGDGARFPTSRIRNLAFSTKALVLPQRRFRMCSHSDSMFFDVAYNNNTSFNFQDIQSNQQKYQIQKRLLELGSPLEGIDIVRQGGDPLVDYTGGNGGLVDNTAPVVAFNCEYILLTVATNDSNQPLFTKSAFEQGLVDYADLVEVGSNFRKILIWVPPPQEGYDSLPTELQRQTDIRNAILAIIATDDRYELSTNAWTNIGNGVDNSAADGAKPNTTFFDAVHFGVQSSITSSIDIADNFFSLINPGSSSVNRLYRHSMPLTGRGMGGKHSSPLIRVRK